MASQIISTKFKFRVGGLNEVSVENTYCFQVFVRKRKISIFRSQYYLLPIYSFGCGMFQVFLSIP